MRPSGLQPPRRTNLHKALNLIHGRKIRPPRVQIVRFVRVCGGIVRIGRNDLGQRWGTDDGRMGEYAWLVARRLSWGESLG